MPIELIGNNQLCLLLHGFASGPQEVSYLAKYLNEGGYTVRAIRLEGHGSHPADLEKVKYTDWIQQVESEIISVVREDYEKIFVIGFSMGALLALNTASLREVNAIIGISPSLYLFDRKLHYLPLKQLLTLLSIFISDINRKADNQFLYHGNFYNRYIYPVIPLTSISELIKLSEFTSGHLGKVDKPLLLIHALDDKTCDVKGSYFIYSRVKSTKKQKKILQNGGHLIVLNDMRDLIYTEIVDFLNEIE